MGKLKERLTTTISADLVRWRRIEEKEFMGTIYNSIDRSLHDDVLIRITFMDVCFYPTLTGHWEAHYIGRNIEGKYIRMEIKHMLMIRPGS